eukprot:TRINITY_DN67928_c5_g14_i1.p1 TRINITY_DN67928_c5_g14~~TRINITY_DN67928_c5_g14_i1.p1  ORF type:complete len:192 (-),score=70.22 TRINITY_DN67928_c5_g14_i1:100-675(-)
MSKDNGSESNAMFTIPVLDQDVDQELLQYAVVGLMLFVCTCLFCCYKAVTWGSSKLEQQAEDAALLAALERGKLHKKNKASLLPQGVLDSFARRGSKMPSGNRVAPAAASPKNGQARLSVAADSWIINQPKEGKSPSRGSRNGRSPRSSRGSRGSRASRGRQQQLSQPPGFGTTPANRASLSVYMQKPAIY